MSTQYWYQDGKPVSMVVRVNSALVTAVPIYEDPEHAKHIRRGIVSGSCHDCAMAQGPEDHAAEFCTGDCAYHVGDFPCCASARR